MVRGWRARFAEKAGKKLFKKGIYSDFREKIVYTYDFLMKLKKDNDKTTCCYETEDLAIDELTSGYWYPELEESKNYKEGRAKVTRYADIFLQELEAGRIYCNRYRKIGFFGHVTSDTVKMYKRMQKSLKTGDLAEVTCAVHEFKAYIDNNNLDDEKNIRVFARIVKTNLDSINRTIISNYKQIKLLKLIDDSKRVQQLERLERILANPKLY